MTNAELGTPTAEPALPVMQGTSSMEETVSLEAEMEEEISPKDAINKMPKDTAFLVPQDIICKAECVVP